jgi:hypothetical protein
MNIKKYRFNLCRFDFPPQAAWFFIASFLLVLFVTTLIFAEEKADEKRLDEVAERGCMLYRLI